MAGESTCSFSPTEFILFLHGIPHLGEKSLAHLLRLHSQRKIVPEVFCSQSASELQRQYDISSAASNHVANGSAMDTERASVTAKILRRRSIQVLTSQSATFPARLEAFDDAPPPVLYTMGNFAALNPAGSDPSPHFTFTCATSNRATAEMLASQDEIANALIDAGGVPVTGHDRTPYQRLALSAQRKNRPVCYVFDRGLREALGPEFDRPPFAAARIRDANFMCDRDLALSPFRLDDHSIGTNNRRRDRLVFALADVVVAVDVGAGGGMEEECFRAHRFGRTVIVAPNGRAGKERLTAAGCPRLPTDADWAHRTAENEAAGVRQEAGRDAG